MLRSLARWQGSHGAMYVIMYPAIVLFDPVTKTLEEVGHLEDQSYDQACVV